MCRRCGKNRLFSKLKKYYQGEDKAKAKLMRAYAQAKINGREEAFERAMENGVLTEDIDEAFPSAEYVDKQGIDTDAVKGAVERLLESPEVSASHRDILREAITTQEDPSVVDLIAYAQKQGMDPITAGLKLEKLTRVGDIDTPDSITHGAIEEWLGARLGQEDTEVKNADTEPQGSVGGKFGAVMDTAIKYDGESLTELISLITSQGISEENALIYLERLIRDGEVLVSVDTAEIEEAASAAIAASSGDASHETNQPGSSSTSEKYKQVFEEAREKIDNPKAEEIVEYATKRDVPRAQAISGLKKLLQSGQMIGGPNLDIERIEDLKRSAVETDSDATKSESVSSRNSSDDSESSKSQREIIKDAIVEGDTESDAVKYAVKRGVEQEKAARYIGKLIQRGQATVTPDGTLRAL
jgi:hypothetical protein